MGCPIDSYTVLESILLGHTDFAARPREALAFARATSRFSVLAFVLFDPVQHAAFADKIQNDFEYLDHATGEHLLFFALCNPSRQWREDAAERAYMRAMGGMGGRAAGMVNLAANRVQTSLDARAIASNIGLKPEDLPAIVLTQDVLDDGFTFIRTNEDHVFEQLSRLGFIARQLSQGRSPGPVEELFADLDPGFSAQQLQIARPLGEAFAEVLAAVQLEGQGHGPLRELARQRLERGIQNALERMNALRRQIAADDQMNLLDAHESRAPANREEDLDRLAETGLVLATLLARLTGDVRRTGSLRSDRDGGLEPLTNDLLATGDRVFGVLSEQPSLNDFSPYILCLSKALENELNHSIVQWARQERGIEMPKYFAIPAPRRDEDLVHLPGWSRPVDINGQSGERWKSLTMGPAIELTNHLVDNGNAMPVETLQQRWREFYDLCDAARRDRNRCAHPVSLLGPHDARRARDRHAEFQGRGLWEAMMNLKKQIRRDHDG